MEEIRMVTREIAKIDRRKFREAFLDHLRKDCEEKTTSSNTQIVTSIAEKLKSKSQIQRKELAYLKNVLLEKEENIAAFFKVSGSLRGLVRELSGNDAHKQISAAACCCNLSLGPAKSCMAVAKAAGPYLISYLKSMNKELAITSAWALGNLSAADAKICRLLKMQGAILKLNSILEETDDLELIDSIAYSLSHYIRTCDDYDHISTDKVMKKLINLDSRNAYCYWLIYLLTFEQDFYKVDFWCVIKIFDDMVEMLNQSPWNDNVISIDCILRIIANCCDNSLNCNIFLNYILQNSFTKSTVAKIFSCSNPQLKANLMWVLGNLYNYAPDSTEKNDFFIEIGNILKKACP